MKRGYLPTTQVRERSLAQLQLLNADIQHRAKLLANKMARLEEINQKFSILFDKESVDAKAKGKSGSAAPAQDAGSVSSGQEDPKHPDLQARTVSAPLPADREDREAD